MKTLYICILSVVLVSGTTYAGDRTPHEQFIALDRNADGVLTRNEVRSRPTLIRFMQLYNQGSFSLADVNNDGVLNLEEFTANEEVISAE